MLSFMREQDVDTHASDRNEKRESRNEKPESRSEKPESRSEKRETRNELVSAKASAGAGYVAVAARQKQVRKTTYLLAGLFILGLLCLWLMIMKSPAPMSAANIDAGEELGIGRTIIRLTGVKSEMFNRMSEIVKKFYQFSDTQQVGVDELVKNPFEFDTGYSARIKNRESRSEMQLLSIMRSNQGNCCMIDDRILYEGDSIRGFKVHQIGDSFVKLKSENSAGRLTAEHEVILKLLE